MDIEGVKLKWREGAVCNHLGAKLGQHGGSFWICKSSDGLFYLWNYCGIFGNFGGSSESEPKAINEAEDCYQRMLNAMLPGD